MRTNHPLRKWRKEHGQTAHEFGRTIGVDKSTVVSYELGRRRPRWDTLSKIIVATEGRVTAKDFMTPEPAE